MFLCVIKPIFCVVINLFQKNILLCVIELFLCVIQPLSLAMNDLNDQLLCVLVVYNFFLISNCLTYSHDSMPRIMRFKESYGATTTDVHYTQLNFIITAIFCCCNKFILIKNLIPKYLMTLTYYDDNYERLYFFYLKFFSSLWNEFKRSYF